MKKIRLVLISSVLLAAGLTSCSNSGTATLSEADKAAITKSATDINKAFNETKDYKAYVNDYYAEDATILYPNTDAVKGREAILAVFSTLGNDINVTPTILEVNGKDDLAYVYGNVLMETNAKVELDHGKYIEVWKKQEDGKWKVIYDIYNSSVPLVSDTTIKK
jgi:ketosteroid isomerase-like protein